MAETKSGKYAGYVKFSGTKAQFIEKGYENTYADKIVFIGNGECIFTRGMYFANFNELIAAINYVKGVKVGSNTYNAKAGGGYVEFTGATNNTVTLDVENGKITIGLTDAFIKRVSDVETEIANIKKDYATTSAMNTAIGNAKTELKGASSDASTAETIYGAKKYAEEKASAAQTAAEGYADTKKSEVIGASGDASTVNTIYGAKAYADAKKSEVLGTAEDASTANTIYGAKAYADAKVAEVNGVASGIDTRLQVVEKDYLKSADKTELGNRITNEAPVTITEAAGSGDILKSYTFTQNGSTIGTINLAKELVVTGGEIVEIDGVKNLQLTIANQTVPVNIPVNELVDVYTAKLNAAQVQVAISNTNEISASIVAKSITATELNDNAVETAKIKDGNVTKAKLESTVQTSLGKADTAVQSVVTGTTNGTINVDGTAVPVYGLKSAAYTESSAYATSAQGAKADSALQSVEGSTYVEVTTKSSNKQTISIKKDDIISGLATDANAQGYANTAESNAKAYADSKWEWIDLD